MPRNRETVRKRLQWAALELFRERGYVETTAAEIAAKAGVTERTFSVTFQTSERGYSTATLRSLKQ